MPTQKVHGTHSANAAEFVTQYDDVFSRIALKYDLLCDIFSVGIHRLWKRQVASLIVAEPWKNLLDVAAGTGDVALRVVGQQALSTDQTMIVTDICPNMLSVAKKRAGALASQLDFAVMDAHHMPDIETNSMDVYAISLGLKICDREKVFAEALRILRPGGRFIALEASNIRWAWLHRMYLSYMQIVMPMVGWLATGGDASAYRYLLKGIQGFPTAEDLALEMQSVGFCDVQFERLSMGIVAIHSARKPF